MKEMIKVQGISCGNCVQAIEGSVSEIQGVSAVEVALSSGEVTVTFDDDKTTLKKVKEVIEEQGYNVV